MTSRRKMLTAVGALLSCVPLLSLADIAQAKGVPSQDRLDKWADLFPSVDNAGHIGRRYLDIAPDECDAAVLAAKISRNIEASMRQAPLPFMHEHISARASRAVRRDFERGNVVTVDGWVLSRTEARLCALVELQRVGAAA